MGAPRLTAISRNCRPVLILEMVVGWMVAVGSVGSKYFLMVKGGTTLMYLMYSPAYTRNRSLDTIRPVREAGMRLA